MSRTLRPGWQREKLVWKAGELLCGLDEVGTGAWAGPVYAGAVVFTNYVRVPFLADSKALSAGERERAAMYLEEHCVWAIGRADVFEIEELGLRRATFLAMQRAFHGVQMKLGSKGVQRLVIDALSVPFTTLPQESVIRGDAKVASIAAASILAKVHRDRVMRELDLRLPGYGFGVHKGYGTKGHQEALLRLGVSSEHRKNYAPISKIISKIG